MRLKTHYFVDDEINGYILHCTVSTIKELETEVCNPKPQFCRICVLTVFQFTTFAFGNFQSDPSSSLLK
jgi:hypothetical protein